MFSITVALKDNPVVWTLLYRTVDSFSSARDLLVVATEPKDRVHLADDFGQTALIHPHTIAGVLFEDLDQSKMAHIERAMHTERVKIQAQNAAQSDPIIKNAMRTAQRGPAIFDPTMQNGSGPPRF